MERGLQTCLEQSKENPIPDDFTITSGSLTTDINGTITYMLHYVIPKDEVDNESEYHNTIRTQTERPIQTPNDRVLGRKKSRWQ